MANLQISLLQDIIGLGRSLLSMALSKGVVNDICTCEPKIEWMLT